jgi:putative chitinase
MFPEKMRSGQEDIVTQGWPTLITAMKKYGITSPRQIAAFLMTAAYESNGEFSRREDRDTRPYGGRGYCQLTGDVNYNAYWKYSGVDILSNPEWARNLANSADIFGWYWTKNRTGMNDAADGDNIGYIIRGIGYPIGDGSEDKRRCAAYARAVKYMTGTDPVSVDCTR